MQIIQLLQAQGDDWQQAQALYCDIFPPWEREAVADIEQAIKQGKTRCVIVRQNNTVIGVSLTELYPQHAFALLGYLFIDPKYQGQGLGQRLCRELFEFIQQHHSIEYLLVEAEAGPEAFYEKLGFQTFAIDYRSPHYDDDQETSMALMYQSQLNTKAPSWSRLCAIVEHIYTHSYYLNQDDPRRHRQVQRILSKENQ